LGLGPKSKSYPYIYCSQLWGANYKKNFYEIYDYFLAPFHKDIFGFFLHKISPGVIKSIQGIGNWYMKKYYTFFRMFRAIGTSHFLPKYVSDKLLVREITYQAVEKGSAAYLSENN